jgi:magnesium-protoporphyrin IX monomethyl ester (oxidative) cyclase
MSAWIPLITHLEPPAGNLIRIRYDRFSVYFNTPQRFGLRLVPNRAYAHVYPLPEPALREAAYFFEDLNDLTPTTAPGHKALARELKRWQAAFAGAGGAVPARLLAEDQGDRVIVRDTRPGAVAAQMVLAGVDCLVWRHCDSATTIDGLTKATAAPEAAIRDAVQRLRDMKLVIEWRGRILGLSVRAPVVPYLDPVEFSGYDLNAMLAYAATRSLARVCVRLPGEVPLSEFLA